jgi:hypothetical protein
MNRLERRTKNKQERQEQIKQQRAHYQRRERNKRIFNYAIGIVVLIAIAYGLFLLLGPEPAGEYDAFAQCLTKAGATMYGTDWCSHCQDQKRMFGPSFAYITFINCDANAAACDAAGVEGYPTWIFPTGPAISGKQEFATLAERTRCEAP